MVFTYCIVPKGASHRNAPMHGNLYAPNSDVARRYLQTVKAPNVRGRTDLEVIVKDSKGKEVWRGPYTGPDVPD